MALIASEDDLDRCGPPLAVFRIPLLSSVRFELRPADRLPPPKYAVTFMYRRSGEDVNQAGVGVLVDGEWTNGKGKKLDPENLYWTAMVDEF